ncbi:MAG: hypothetical protein Q4D84_07210 [Campylobacter sp.]|nr:hypothetical protein [Campylobacter sp.]
MFIRIKNLLNKKYTYIQSNKNSYYRPALEQNYYLEFKYAY